MLGDDIVCVTRMQVWYAWVKFAKTRAEDQTKQRRVLNMLKKRV